MFTLISYDIPDDRRRNRLAELLLDFGCRVQFSVFEAHLDAELIAKMAERIITVIEPNEDKVRIYTLCKSCEEGVHVFGTGTRTKPSEVFIV